MKTTTKTGTKVDLQFRKNDWGSCGASYRVHLPREEVAEVLERGQFELASGRRYKLVCCSDDGFCFLDAL